MSASSATKTAVETGSKERRGRYVQFGCGLCAPAGWDNFDSSYTLRFERIPIVGLLSFKNPTRFPKQVMYGDIVKGLPVPDESCQGVYASHVLEHLSREECLQALRNTYRMLERGGTFRLLVPDLEVVARRYLADIRQTAAASHMFLESTGLGRESRPKGFLRRVYSTLQTSSHQWMWDHPSMMDALAGEKFRDIRRCNVGDSADPMFQKVEDALRFEDAVAIEARK